MTCLDQIFAAQNSDLQVRLRHWLDACLADAGFEFVARDKDFRLWDEVLVSSGHAPSLLTHSGLSFQQAVNASRVERLVDLSGVLRPKGGRDGLVAWPLGLVWDEAGHSRFSTLGLDHMAPILAKSVAPKLLRRLLSVMHDVTENMSRTLGVACVWSQAWGPRRAYDPWMTDQRARGAPMRVRDEMVVDLRSPYSAIHAKFRKSYRPLVGVAQRHWKIEARTEVGELMWERFHALHVAVAGRETRTAASWALQYKAIQNGDALLTTVEDADGELVGGAFFFLSRHEASYAVAAYRRDLFDRPLGHGAQSVSIQKFQELGKSWYWLGSLPDAEHQPEPTEKEVQIAHFKKGFAMQLEPSFVLGPIPQGTAT